jgi:hypothetical protein
VRVTATLNAKAVAALLAGGAYVNALIRAGELSIRAELSTSH